MLPTTAITCLKIQHRFPSMKAKKPTNQQQKHKIAIQQHQCRNTTSQERRPPLLGRRLWPSTMVQTQRELVPPAPSASICHASLLAHSSEAGEADQHTATRPRAAVTTPDGGSPMMENYLGDTVQWVPGLGSRDPTDLTDAMKDAVHL